MMTLTSTATKDSVVVRIPTLVIAGTSSGVGKTTVTVGIMLALSRQLGKRVQPFKVGPDFLDGMRHTVACGGIASVNLDGWMMGQAGCVAAFNDAVYSSNADIAIVEGCMGLHDGRDGLSDDGSTAQVAKWLGKPTGPEQINFLRYRPVLSNRRLKEEFGYQLQKTSAETFEYFIEQRGLRQ